MGHGILMALVILLALIIALITFHKPVTLSKAVSACGIFLSVAMVIVTLILSTEVLSSSLPNTTSQPKQNNLAQVLKNEGLESNNVVKLANAGLPQQPKETTDVAALLNADKTSAPPKIEAAASGGDAKDTIANAMTAVGTAIAAVTLILSLGTTWFATKLKELDEHRVKVNEELQQLVNKYNHALTLTEQQNNAFVELSAAKQAIGRYMETITKSPYSQWNMGNELCFALERLLSKNEVERREAYDKLIAQLPDLHQLTSSTRILLAPVFSFTKVCHEMHGGSDNKIGVWCLVFSGAERAHFADSHASNDLY